MRPELRQKLSWALTKKMGLTRRAKEHHAMAVVRNIHIKKNLLTKKRER